MKSYRKHGLALFAALALAVPASAQDKKPGETPMPTPADLKSLTANQPGITLKGQDDSAQLIVTAQLNDGKLQDLTGNVQYEIADAKLARISSLGRIIPLVNGSTTITAKFGDKSVQVTLKNEAMDTDLPINFTNQIVPIFTKLGCNSGGCHGKSGGQNGFALSLLGFVPELDYQTLVKEDRGRRLFPAAADSSLLLLKATGQMAHEIGRASCRERV